MSSAGCLFVVCRALRREGLQQQRADAVHDVAGILVGHAGTARQAEAGPEKGLAHAAEIGRAVSVHWLAVHGLPQRAGLDAQGVQADAEGLHVGVRLAVSVGRVGCVGHSGGASHRALYGAAVGILLALDAQLRVDGHRVQPVVAVVPLIRVLVEGDAVHVLQQFPVQGAHVLVMSDVCVRHRHLTPADTRTDVRHAVVVADALVLVVGIRLAGLGRVEHDLVLRRRIGADESTAARGRNHLVAVERQHAVPAERAQHPSVEPGAEALRSILYHRDTVAAGYLHYLINPVGHAVQSHRDDRLGSLARPGDTVLDRLLQQSGIHIPGLFFRIHEHRPRPKIGHRMRRSAEREALHHHLIPGPNPAGYQRQMHRRRTRRKGHHLLTLAHKLPQVVLEPVHIGPQRNHPVGIEGLLYEGLLRPAHVSEAEVNSFCHKISMILINNF